MKLRRARWTLAVKALGAGLFIWIMLRWFEHSQVYHPARTLDATGAELGRPFENFTFATSDGTKLNGWFFPADSHSPRARIAVLVCHGNAGNISHRLGLSELLLETGVNVLVFDYRGYGRSQGHPSEAGTYLDAQAAHQWLTAKGFAPKNIVLYGESLGGGVASELALREVTGGIILQSTFTSIPDVGAELFPWLPVRWLAHIRYDTRSRMPRLRVPVLILHSRADELVRFHHAEENFAAANEPKLLCELTGEHNDGLLDREAFRACLERFFALISPFQAPAAEARN